jgi:hypothetical protein
LMAELILRPEDGLQGIISCFMWRNKSAQSTFIFQTVWKM